MQRAVNKEKIALTKQLKKAIAENTKYKQKAAKMAEKLKINKREIAYNVEKITKNNNCVNMGANWRGMHNGIVERFKSFKTIDRRDKKD